MTGKSGPIAGQMQPHALRVTDILEHARRAHGSRTIVSRQVDEPDWRGTYADLAVRAARAAHALQALGVEPGDRVSTLAWNNVRHLELFYAVPGIGAVLATANPRLFDDQIVFTINHAGSRWLLFDRNMLELVERLANRLEHVEHYIMLSDAERHVAGSMGALCYDRLTECQPETIAWLSSDENDAAVLCYTSGTTGDPKGVLYSHRAIVLHAMAASSSGVFAISAFDAVMPCSSLYHATGWGLSYIAPMHGAKIVLPGDRLTPSNLHELIKQEEVTFSVGVPTIWTAYLEHVEQIGSDTGSLQRIVIGGAAVPQSLAQRLSAYGVFVLQVWGMTELSPIGTASTVTPASLAVHGDSINNYLWARQGRALFGVEFRITSEDGSLLPADGQSSGAIAVRGPWVVDRYYQAETVATDGEGWFDTGDIGTIDPLGYMRLTDRAKDVIKSGGEWISSIDIENVAVGYHGVKLAAVIGAPHPRWDERPVLVIEPADGALINEAELIAYLTPHMAKWWLPDIVIQADIPLTSTGKIDKKTLRVRYAQVFAHGAT